MLLLAPDSVTVSRPQGGEDAHGWATAGTPTVVWEGFGNVQVTARGTVTAQGFGDRGPYAPEPTTTPTAYLPPEALVLAGDVLTVEGRSSWVVRTVEAVVSPPGASLDHVRCELVDVP